MWKIAYKTKSSSRRPHWRRSKLETSKNTPCVPSSPQGAITTVWLSLALHHQEALSGSYELKKQPKSVLKKGGWKLPRCNIHRSGGTKCSQCWVSSKAQCLLASMEEAINVVQQARHTEQEKCACIFFPQRFVIVKTSGWKLKRDLYYI